MKVYQEKYHRNKYFIDSVYHVVLYEKTNSYDEPDICKTYDATDILLNGNEIFTNLYNIISSDYKSSYWVSYKNDPW